MDRSTKPEYLHWSVAGGPNECEQGYAEGIPCPNCDKIPLVIALRAENERLTRERDEARELPCMHSSPSFGAVLAEIERLRTALEKIASSGNVHSSWLVGDAREALGLSRNTW